MSLGPQVKMKVVFLVSILFSVAATLDDSSALIRQVTEDQVVRQGDAIYLQCLISTNYTSEDFSVDWLKTVNGQRTLLASNGSRVVGDGFSRLRPNVRPSVDGLEYVLMVLDAQPLTDDGAYTCQVTKQH